MSVWSLLIMAWRCKTKESPAQRTVQLGNQNSPKVIAKTRKDLLAYCKMDTLAMVEILAVLKQTA